jgi:hypothetical protein
VEELLLIIKTFLAKFTKHKDRIMFKRNKYLKKRKRIGVILVYISIFSVHLNEISIDDFIANFMVLTTLIFVNLKLHLLIKLFFSKIINMLL